MIINLLIVNYHSSHLIRKLLDSIPDPNSKKYHIVIINNSIEDDNIYHLQSDIVEVINSPSNLGFGGACNVGIQTIFQRNPHAIIWLLNPDAYFPSNDHDNYWDFLQEIWEQQNHLSLLGTRIITTNGDIWFSGGKFQRSFGLIQSETDPKTRGQSINECDWLSGCSLMINLNKFITCPYFDPDFFLYYEDFDFCTRYKLQGHHIAIANELEIIHQVSAITNQDSKNKIFHSSYSYLLALYKHTNRIAFCLHLLKFILNTCILSIINMEIGRAKYQGLKNFLQQIQTKHTADCITNHDM